MGSEQTFAASNPEVRSAGHCRHSVCADERLLQFIRNFFLAADFLVGSMNHREFAGTLRSFRWPLFINKISRSAKIRLHLKVEYRSVSRIILGE